jgi:mannitol operon transcriptional antiterminator
MLSKVTPSDLLLEERRLLAYIKLLDASEPLKLAPLANDLGVSVTTLSADLDELSNWLKTYNLTLERKKGVGVELVGDEESKREALVSYSLIHFEDELIDHLFSLSNDQYQTDKLLFSFQREYLKVIDNIVYESINQFHLKIADRDYIASLFFMSFVTFKNWERVLPLSKQIE